MVFSSLERQILKRGYEFVAGIDEAGRGALVGPVAAAIVAVNWSNWSSSNFIGAAPIKIRDSKQLSEKQREEIFEKIKNNPHFEWRVSFVWPRVIDRINIWQATLLAWRRCLKKSNLCPAKPPKGSPRAALLREGCPRAALGRFGWARPNFLFLDGKMGLPGIKIEQKPVIKGDQKIFLLSLASVIAKVSRDRLMRRLDRKYPQYGFAQHKGYGTKLHLERLKKFGPCQIHRKSFRPVFANLSFQEKVYYIVSQIPYGQTMAYREVAQRVGQPRAWRAVGNALNKNTTLKIPCHRVIRSDGKIGGYSHGSKLKEKLLRKEKFCAR